MTLAGLRRILYAVARFLGDVRAILTRRVGRRVYNRIVGRLLTRAFRKGR